MLFGCPRRQYAFVAGSCTHALLPSMADVAADVVADAAAAVTAAAQWLLLVLLLLSLDACAPSHCY